MDLSSTFKTEVYRPVVTIVVPGGLAISPWIYLAGKKYQFVAECAKSNQTAFVIVLLLLAIVAGFLLENIGARIEGNIWDQIQGNPDELKEEWYKYLRIAFNPEPVGHRYLRSITLRMKFELAFGLSIIPFAVGFMISSVRWGWLPKWMQILFPICAAIVSGLCIWESYCSSKLLRTLRHEMLKGISLHPAGTQE